MYAHALTHVRQRRPRRPAGLALGFCLIVFAFNRSLKSKNIKTNSPSRPKRKPRPWRPPQLRMPRRLDSQTTESMKHTNNMPLMPVNAASIAQSNPWPMGPSLVGLSAAVNSKIVCSSKQWCCLNSTRTLSGANLALQDTDALAAAEYGRLAVWEHSPFLLGLGVASIAAGRCISAGAPSRPLTRFRF